MNAAILSVGDELTCGDRVDTNSAWIARRLAARGVRLIGHVSAPDDEAEIVIVLAELADRADLVVSTGGLGPTLDDVTRFALAKVMNEELITDEAVLASLERRFARRDMAMPRANRVQAQRPASADFLPNPLGTAPGIDARITSRSGHSCRMLFLPGVPVEMKRMFEDSVRPLVDEAFRGRAEIVFSTSVQAVSIPESRVADLLSDLMERGRDPIVGTLVSEGVISVRIHSSGKPGDVERRVEKVARMVIERLGPYVYGRDDEPLSTALMQRLTSRGKTYATAESCTGGLLGKMITDPAGASACYLGGWQTYSNPMKMSQLGVTREILETHGAVSEETANAMALGALDRSGADFALSITGVAGPEGGSDEKPVGTVYIGLAWRDEASGGDASAGRRSIAKRFQFAGAREMVRQRSATSALAMLLFHLDHGGDLPLMLWEPTTRTDARG